MVRRPESKPSARLRLNEPKGNTSKDISISQVARHLLEYFPTLLAAIATFLTLAALIHEWGFYSALNINFGQSPIGVADQFKILLSLIPSIVRDTSILTLFGTLLAGFEGPNGKGLKLGPGFFSPLDDPYKFLAHILLIGAGILFAIFILFRPPQFYFIEIVNTLVLGILLLGTRSFLNKELGAQRLLAVGAVILIYTPFWLYSAGYRSALEGTSDSTTTLFFKNSEQPTSTSITGTLLRSYDRQILIRTEDGQAIFLPTEGVERIQFSKSKKEVGLVCKWFATSCN